MTDLDRTARLDILAEGYARRPNVASTVSLVRDAEPPPPGPHRQHRSLPPVPVHDFQWVVDGDVITTRDADGVQLTPRVRLLATPGHTPQDLSTLVGTSEGVAVLTHLWWTAEGPAEDPYAPDRELLREQRERVLALATTIVPGHGGRFRPTRSTPR